MGMIALKHPVRPELVEGLSFCSSRTMAFWTYIPHCRGGTFYTGHTDNLEHRIGQHESGDVAGFSSDRLPVKLVWSDSFGTRIEALEMERRIKGWSRAKKMALIRGDWNDLISLSQPKK